jgi:hypothetical protein
VSAANGSVVAQDVIATGGTTADYQQSGGTFTVFENNLSQDGSAASFGGPATSPTVRPSTSSSP